MPTIVHPIWLSITVGFLLQETPEPIVVQQAANWTSVAMTVIAIIPATIAAVFGGMAVMQSRRNAEVAASTAVAVQTNIQKTEAVDTKATEIHTLTNSNLSKVQAQLEVSQKTIEGLNAAQVESARQMASMQQLITSLIPAKGEQNPSQTNSTKLDTLTAMVSDVQQGKPPIPVEDKAVLEKLTVIADKTDKKLDTIQESADVAAAKDKAGDS